MSEKINDANVESQEVLITPEQLKQALPQSQSVHDFIVASRRTVRDILDKKDHRLFVVIGPCSIHDTKAALDYAERLKQLSDKIGDTIYVIMRVYFEKPRTTVGWKGLINDPNLNNTFDIEKGLHVGRKLLIDIAEIGLPLATEALDPISPQYLQDMITWSAIGARTTESQTHREMASGLSSPVGFKNGTDGNLTVAINALESVSNAHSFLGINTQGQVAIIRTKGNQYGHVVLRGGSHGPNYNATCVQECEQALEKNHLPQNIVVDCSHANSNKDPAKQVDVVNDVIKQIQQGNRSIIGLMIESNIGWGNQKILDDKSQMKYGVSVTDACIDWDTTESCLLNLADKLKDVLVSRLN